MPLSDRRLRKCDLQHALDKLRGKAKEWIHGAFSIDARMILVKHILAAMPLFMLALAPPVWLTKAMDRIGRGFFWAKDEIALGGKCLVKWKLVCRPAIFTSKLYSHLIRETLDFVKIRLTYFILLTTLVEPGAKLHHSCLRL
jgi:hypothetical protein